MRYLILPLLLSCTTTPDDDVCTNIGCTSSLAIELEHSLDLTQGPWGIYVYYPGHELRCSVGSELEGTGTCFGFRFTDLSWNEERIDLFLTDPFTISDDNPDGVPFSAVQVEIRSGPDILVTQDFPVEAGDPQYPNGPECGGECWSATVQGTLLDPPT